MGSRALRQGIDHGGGGRGLNGEFDGDEMVDGGGIMVARASRLQAGAVDPRGDPRAPGEGRGGEAAAGASSDAAQAGLPGFSGDRIDCARAEFDGGEFVVVEWECRFDRVRTPEYILKRLRVLPS